MPWICKFCGAENGPEYPRCSFCHHHPDDL